MAPSSTAHELSTGLIYAAAGLYAIGLLVTLARPAWGRWPVALGALLHSIGTVIRGVLISYFPLTNKFESFSAFALALAVVAAFSWKPRRLYTVPILLVLGAGLAAAHGFGPALTDAPPLMRTIWYPLHVPASFFAYGLWTAAAAASLVWLQVRDQEWLERINDLALWGFGLWSFSMICGGVWGVLAWGAYFLWDPKVLWSVILWFHYATFVHIRLAPSLQSRPWLRPTLALVGLGIVFVAYVGTSFLFGNSSHAWS